MANHKSAIKRIRQTERRNEVNSRNRSALRSQVKELQNAIAGKADGTSALDLVNPTVGQIDRAVQKGVLHKNTASRMKSRLTKRANRASKEA
jgi:small subunit ribosomal protein S20